MLAPVLHLLKNKKIVLASQSPRRQELIQKLGIKVDLCPSLFEEDLDPKKFSFPEYVQETALQKVLEVDGRLKEKGTPADLIIGADTMVTLGNEMFGKPKSPTEAFETLTKLTDKRHTVFTGVALKFGERVIKFVESTDVFFGKATPEQIQAYVDSGEPFDKAGGYGVQGAGGTFIRRIEGDYFTVVGLPLYRTCVEICELLGK